MASPFASVRLGMTRERVEFWRRVPGCAIALLDGVYRFERAAEVRDQRQPSPAPIPEALALEAIAAGLPVRRDGDLFGRAA